MAESSSGQSKAKRKTRKKSKLPRGYIVHHFDEALAKKWIKVYYQPIVRTISNQLCAMEALARWDDPTYGFLTPPQFIGILEQHNVIDKLDRYMIEEVCRNFARLREAGREPVPVSLNLSRLDFITCNIFEVVEETLRRYDMPRDMLHLEIVESVLTDRVKVIGNILDKFRSAGYEIWMDDFGSGYSTLNFLKDQRFDVLKMDMAFLKSDTKRARDIITSIIAMDRRIGNRTLAEGVETEEQYRFLRDSGCEKVQGYFLGRPMSYDDSVQECMQHGIGIESRNWKSYYDAIARVDFLTESPLMLLEYENGHFHVLFANKNCEQLLWPEDEQGQEKWESRFNASQDPRIRYLHHGLVRIAQTNEPEEFSYAKEDMVIHMDVQLVVKREQRYLFEVHCRKKNRIHEEEQITPQKIMQGIFYFFDAFFVLDARNDQILLLTNLGEKLSGRSFSLRDAVQLYKEEHVYAADWQLCEDFFRTDNLPERMAAQKNGILCSFFRTKWRNRSLLWKSHIIIRLPQLGPSFYLGLIRDADVQKEEEDPISLEKQKYATGAALPAMQNSRYERPKAPAGQMEEQADGQGLMLWHNFVENFSIPVFWKNKNRQFVGVNQAFLDFYGFDSADRLINRDDEDMNWHIQGEEFRQKELSVIREGKSYHDVLGGCIAKGVLRDILATKWPLYDQEGKIVGLMGYFLPAERIRQQDPQGEALLFRDKATGLSDVRGILYILARYVEDYKIYHHAFAMIFCHIPELVRILHSYGEDACQPLLQDIAAKMIKVVGQRGTIGRFDTGQFVILLHYEKKDQVAEIAKAVHQGIEDIHRFGPYNCTLFANMEIEYPDGSENFYMKMVRHLQ